MIRRSRCSEFGAFELSFGLSFGRATTSAADTAPIVIHTARKIAGTDRLSLVVSADFTLTFRMTKPPNTTDAFIAPRRCPDLTRDAQPRKAEETSSHRTSFRA